MTLSTAMTDQEATAINNQKSMISTRFPCVIQLMLSNAITDCCGGTTLASLAGACVLGDVRSVDLGRER